MSGRAAVSLRAEQLTHRYGRRSTGVDQLAFVFDGPGAVAVTGPNGSGKSTLLRILAGLLRPSAGHTALRLNGRDLPAHDRRAAVGLATPELEFYDEFSALENLRFAGECRRLPDPADAALVALERIGLGARARDRVAAYSSGMKQRLRVAFAMLHQPAVLLLDEPGGHLDDAGRDAVRDVVREHAGRGLVVLATNDPQEAQLAERRLELHGRGLGDPS